MDLPEHREALQASQFAHGGENLLVSSTHKDQGAAEIALAKAADHLHPVHLRHVQVTHHHIDRLAAAAHQVHGLDAVTGRQHFAYTQPAQHLGHLHQHHRIVVDHQHRTMRQRGRVWHQRYGRRVHHLVVQVFDFRHHVTQGRRHPGQPALKIARNTGTRLLFQCRSHGRIPQRSHGSRR